MTESQSTPERAHGQPAREKNYSEPALNAECIARFWSKVNVRGPGGCWLWTASVNKKGYGRYGVPDGRICTAHRLAYLLDAGVWPGRLCVLHHCDTPACCNARHLFLGTQTENMADMFAKGRTARGETSGARRHPERVPRGEGNGLSKLKEEDVREIRSRYAAGGALQADLAAEFGVRDSMISRIVNHRNWKHVG
jgi:hypothetical protein